GVDLRNRAVPSEIAGARRPVQPLIRESAGQSTHVQRCNPLGGAGPRDHDMVAGFKTGDVIHREGAAARWHRLIRDAGRGTRGGGAPPAAKPANEKSMGVCAPVPATANRQISAVIEALPARVIWLP